MKKIVYVAAPLVAGILVAYCSTPRPTPAPKGTYPTNLDWMAVPQYDFADSFSEGIAIVKVGERHGFIDRRNRLVVPPRYRGAEGSIDGQYAVYVRDIWSLFGTSKKVVRRNRWKPDTPYECTYYDPTDKGYERFVENGRTGYRDSAQRVIVPAQLVWGRDFSEGLAAVGVEGSAGFIDHSGAFVITPRFQYTKSFSDGLCAVKPKEDPDHFGYIDRTGRMVIPPVFDDVGDFNEGFAPVLCGGKWGFLRKPKL
jgi:DNA-binding transcriptional regulator/RsmH inhibitor MraZ